MKTVILFVWLVIFITIPVPTFAEQSINSNDNFQEGTVEIVSRCIMVISNSIVRVTDYDMNQDSTKIEEITIEVWSDNDNRIVEYVLTETDKNTGIFEGMIFFTTTDGSPGKRIRTVQDSTVFAKYVDRTLPNGSKEKDIVDTSIMSELSTHGWKDNDQWKVTYDPCIVEHLDKNKKGLRNIVIFHPAPLKQVESGLLLHDIKCKENLELIQKYDGTPACVNLDSVIKLMDRQWIGKITSHSMNDREIGYFSLYVLHQYSKHGHNIAIDLSGPSHITQKTIDSYDIVIMSSKMTDNDMFSSNFGNITQSNLEKFFEQNPPSVMFDQGLSIYPLGGFTDNTGTYGPFNQFLSDEQSQTLTKLFGD